MKKSKKNKKKLAYIERDKKERWVNIGKYWTVLSVECWLRTECTGCIYSSYCKPDGDEEYYPIMREVIRKLYLKFGHPPQEFIDRFTNC